MALTGIKIPISVQLDAGDVGKQVAALMSSLQAQLSKGITTNINVQVPKTGTTAASKADPGLAAPLSAAMNSAAQSLNQAAQALTQATKAQAKPSKGAGGPPGGAGSGGGRGSQPPSGPPGPPGSPGLAQGFRGSGADRNFLGVIRDVAAYRVASRATNALFNTFDRGVSVVSEVQNEMTQLNKILNTNKANLEGLKRAAIDTAKEFGKSTTSVLQGFRVFAQQGLPAEEVKKLGRTVALASNVSTFGTEGLSELITAGRKTFGDKEVGETGLKLIDKFLAVEGARAVSESDLADVFKRIGPQAATAGISIDELNALTTIIKERTRSESGEIATALRFIIKNLQDTRTQKNIKAIEGLGDIQFTDPNTGDLRGTFEVLDDIAQRLPTLNRRGRLGVATEVGETRFAARTIALLEGLQAGEGESVINISRGAAGETFKRNQIVMQSLQKQTEQVGASFDALALSLGEGLVGPTTTALAVVREILDVLTAASKVKILGGSGAELGIEDQADSRGVSGADLSTLLLAPLALSGVGRLLGKRGLVSGIGNKAIQAGGGLLGRSTPTSAPTSGLTVGMRATEALSSGILGASLFKGLTRTVTGLGARLLAAGGVSAGAGATGAGILGAGAAPAIIGTILTAAIGTGIYKVFQRLTESSADRADRVGLTDQEVKGRQTVGLVDSLESSFKEIEKLNKQRAVAESKGGLVQQTDLVESGELNRTVPEIDKLIQARAFQNQEALLRNAPLITGVGGKVAGPQEVLFRDDKGEMANVFESSSAFKNLLSSLKSAGTLREQTAATSKVLDSFSERVESASKDSGSTVAQTFEAINRKATGQTLSALDAVLIQQERTTGAITKDLASTDVEAIRKLLTSRGGAGLEPSLAAVGKDSKVLLAQLLGARTGSQVRQTELSEENLTATLEGLFKRLTFQELVDESAQFGENIKSAFDSAKNSTKEIKDGLKKATEGDIIRGTLKDGSQFVARVVKDELGNVMADVFTDLEGREAKTSIREVIRPDRTNSDVVSENLPQTFATGVRKALNSLATDISVGEVIKPRKTLEQLSAEFLGKNASITGFGAGKTLAGEVLKLGPTSLSELSNQAAGTFAGFSRQGAPQFNDSLVKFLDAAETQRNSLQKSIETGESPENFSKETLAQVEAGNIIGTAVSKLGEVFKQFSLSVDKLLQFRIDKANAKAFSTVQTGELAKQFGNAVPQVNLGTDKADLDPLQRALLLQPNRARRKEESDFRLGGLKQVADAIDFNEAKLSELISTATSSALSTVDTEELRKLFSPLIPEGLAGESVTASLTNLLGSEVKDLGPAERKDAIQEISNIFKQLFQSQRGDILSQAEQLRTTSQLDETSLKTASALSQLQIAAEQSGRALQSLEKFQGFDQALVRARGEGPLGAVNKSTQPVFFKELDGRLSQINLAGKNQFEIEKELLRLRSSEEVRSGRTKILDSSGQALSPITDEQLDFERRNLKIREKQARGGFDVSRQRQQLETNQQIASDFINRIGETLATKELTPGARAGLEQIQNDLIGISERPEKDFISRSGKVNLEPFGILQGLDKRIEGLAGPDATPSSPVVKAVESGNSLLQTIANNTARMAGATPEPSNTSEGGSPSDSTGRSKTEGLSGVNLSALRSSGGSGPLEALISPSRFIGPSDSKSKVLTASSALADTVAGFYLGGRSSFIGPKAPEHSKVLTAPSGSGGGKFFKEPLTKLANDIEGIGLKHTVVGPKESMYDFANKETFLNSKNMLQDRDKLPRAPYTYTPADTQSSFKGIISEVLDEQDAAESFKGIVSEVVREPQKLERAQVSRSQESSKDVKVSGEAVAESIKSALDAGADSLTSKLSSAFTSFANTLESVFKSGSVGGTSTTTKDILSSLTERVSSMEASRPSELEAIKEGLSAEFVGKLAQLDATIQDIKSRSSEQSDEELRRQTTQVMTQLADMKGSISKSLQSTSTSEQEVTVLKAQILALESRLTEAASLAQKALGLATTAWGNTR